jgi:hypothetical protein
MYASSRVTTVEMLSKSYCLSVAVVGGRAVQRRGDVAPAGCRRTERVRERHVIATRVKALVDLGIAVRNRHPSVVVVLER